MISSTMNIKTAEAAKQVEMRSLSDAELDAVFGGMCDLRTVRCPVGHLIIWVNCPNGPVVQYTIN
jgi:hypothetical protein